MSLSELIKKNVYDTDKFTDHSYLEPYNTLFYDKTLYDVNILEIGVWTGGSIKLWSDLFVNGKVFGVDIRSPYQINNNVLQNSGNVKLFLETNGYDINFINRHLSDTRFDFIIDDGPHTLESMVFLVKYYSALLKDNGVLVIEDVQDFNWIDTLKEQTPEHLKQFIRVLDLRNVKNQYDDILFIIDKSGKL
jgi:cephalosporin hydroxylase